MTTINLYLHNGVFVPCHDSDQEKAMSLQKNRPYKCKILDDRNPLLSAKYHKMISIVWNNLSDEQQQCYHGNQTAFRHMVEMAAGCVEPIYDFRTGEIVQCRVSVSYDSMSEKDFQEFFSRAKDVIVNQVLRKCKDKEYLNMIMCF